MALYTVSAGGTIRSADVNQFTNALNGTDTATVLSPYKMGVGSNTPGRFIGGLTTAGIPTTGTWNTGDWGFELGGCMILCVSGGTPGAWRMTGPGKYKARMHQAAAQTLPSGGFNVVAYDTIVSGDDPNGNLTTGVGAHYTAPVAGDYLVDVAALSTGTLASNVFGGIFVGASERRRLHHDGGITGTSMAGAARISLAAGDQVFYEFQASSGVWTTTPGAPYTFFDVSFIGA